VLLALTALPVPARVLAAAAPESVDGGFEPLAGGGGGVDESNRRRAVVVLVVDDEDVADILPRLRAQNMMQKL